MPSRLNIDKYSFGGNREKAITRDNYCCVECGMTRQQHMKRFKRDITVDHINGLGRNSKEKDHSLSNLQTLCLPCHGKKDTLRTMTEFQISRMRWFFYNGASRKEIRNEFQCITKDTVNVILRGITWGGVALP